MRQSKRKTQERVILNSKVEMMKNMKGDKPFKGAI